MWEIETIRKKSIKMIYHGLQQKNFLLCCQNICGKIMTKTKIEERDTTFLNIFFSRKKGWNQKGWNYLMIRHEKVIFMSKKLRIQPSTSNILFSQKKTWILQNCIWKEKIFVLSFEWEKPKCKFACKYRKSRIYDVNTCEKVNIEKR